MGCEQSVPVARNTPVKKHESLDETPANNWMAADIARRTTSSALVSELCLGMPECPVRLHHAYCSRRGHSPNDDPSTIGSNRFSVLRVFNKFTGDARDALLAVYSGHGPFGADCAEFCRKELPKQLAKHVSQLRLQKYGSAVAPGHPLYDPSHWPQLTTSEYEDCCRRAYLECNRNLHWNTSIDDSKSGCTATTVHFRGDTITVCNVGDCRAVLGHVVKDSDEEEKEEVGAERDSSDYPLLAIPLTQDHTTTRKDERERVSQAGACEGHLDQANTQKDALACKTTSSDSPRVCLSSDVSQGCSLTRSFGDMVAESLGLSAEPEMLSAHLCLNDKVLVIGSDAVFKYLSNSTVIRLCEQADNAVIACQDIIEAAHDQWLYHEDRTVDMTAIICFLECPRNAGPGTTEDLAELAKRSSMFHSGSKGTSSTASTTSVSTTTPLNMPDVHCTWDDSVVPDTILRL